MRPPKPSKTLDFLLAGNSKADQAQHAKAANERAAFDVYTATQTLNYVLAIGFQDITGMMVSSLRSGVAVVDLLGWEHAGVGVGQYKLIHRFEQPTHLQAMVAAGKWIHTQISKSNVAAPSEHAAYLASIRAQWELVGTPSNRQQPSVMIERESRDN